MAEEQAGQEQTQNAPTEETTSQNQEPFKVYNSKEEYTSEKDSFFRKAYNEGKQKVESDILSKFKNQGIDGESLDDVFEAINSKLSPEQEQEDNSGELEQLRQKIQQFEQERDELRQSLEREKMNQAIGTQKQQAKGQLEAEGELKLDIDKVQALFEMEYDYQYKDGQYYAVKDGVPELDDSGNRKTLSQSMADFAKRENLLVPKKQGTGGSTGGATATEKPSRSEWRKLLRSKSPDDQQRAAEMYNIGKKTGWTWDTK